MHVFNMAFTDAHGLTYDAAVVSVTGARFEANETQVLSSDGSVKPTTRYSLYVTGEYWPSQSAKDDGTLALDLRSLSGGRITEEFDTRPDTSDLAALAETTIRNHFTDVWSDPA
jgi:hypothetical protein